MAFSSVYGGAAVHTPVPRVKLLVAGVAEEVVVRPVTLTDYAEVVHLSRGIYTHNGFCFDYVPSRFAYWMSSPVRFPVGLQVGSRLVGFACYTLMDDGDTLFSEALRIDPDYQKLGLEKAFLSGIFKNDFSSY
eukprot:RCo053526